MKLSALKPNTRNPRKISPGALDRLCASIERDPQFMELRPIVVDDDSIIIGGNQRFTACKKLGMKTIPDSWVRKASGLTPEQRKRFIVVDNAPDGMAGEWDMDMLAEDWVVDELLDVGFDLSGMAEDEEKGLEDSAYTNKIISPVYEPKGDNPPIATLIDSTKTDRLQAEIDAAQLPSDIAQFLKYAANRHTVFHFGRIAEWYCHATPQVQDLMEKSGMVIIDFKKAIEYGFVHLTERLGALADFEDCEDEE